MIKIHGYGILSQKNGILSIKKPTRLPIKLTSGERRTLIG